MLCSLTQPLQACERGRLIRRVVFELKSLDLIKDINVKNFLPGIKISPEGGIVWESARTAWLEWLKEGNDPLKAPLVQTSYRNAKTVEEEFARAVEQTKNRYTRLIQRLKPPAPYWAFVLMRVGIGFVHWVKIQ